MVRECLLQALELKAASIAFPIIGTGGLGFPYDKACQIMISEVINDTHQLETTILKDIRFVVFDQDAKLVSVFQQEFQKITDALDKAVSRQPLFAQDAMPVQAFQQEFTSDDASRIFKSLRKSHRNPRAKTGSTRKVSVQVLQGDLTIEKTDAIVNINALDMNMQKAGTLSKAIAAAAGPALQTECTKLGNKAAGSAVITGAGKLKAKKIIHMIPGEASVQHIQKCIEECLKAAENSKFQSISIPACGTGDFKMSAADSAKATFQALENLDPSLKHLKEIRIILFLSELIPAFTRRLKQYQNKT